MSDETPTGPADLCKHEICCASCAHLRSSGSGTKHHCDEMCREGCNREYENYWTKMWCAVTERVEKDGTDEVVTACGVTEDTCCEHWQRNPRWHPETHLHGRPDYRRVVARRAWRTT